MMQKLVPFTIGTFLFGFILISGCTSHPGQSTAVGSAADSGGVCLGEDSCGFLSIEDCYNRTGCWVDTAANGHQTCKENPQRPGYEEKQSCFSYTSEDSCTEQGGCDWTPNEDFIPEVDRTPEDVLTPEEKLLSGRDILVADFDGDQVDESVRVSDDQSIIGIVKNQEVAWYTEGWVNHEDGSGNSGWNLGENDNFFAGDFDGDGKRDLIVWSGNGQWLGTLRESQGELVAGSIVHDWVNHEGGSGNTGWNLKTGDEFLPGDFNGDGQDEIAVVFLDDNQWMGLLEVNSSGRLVALGIVNDWVNHEGGSGNTGWNLRQGDQFEVRPFTNSPDEIFVRSRNGRWEGIIVRKNNTLVAGTITQLN